MARVKSKNLFNFTLTGEMDPKNYGRLLAQDTNYKKMAKRMGELLMKEDEESIEEFVSKLRAYCKAEIARAMAI